MTGTAFASASEPTHPRALKPPVPPPVLFFLFLLAGVGADYLLPLPFLPDTIAMRLGAAGVFFCAAVAIAVWSFRSLRARHTSPEFGEPVTALVEEGPYSHSRNPLYIALSAALAGFACALNSGWIAGGVVLLVIALDRLVVAREERFLETLFGAEYAGYRRRVRRWL